jgi:hypothetical protein
MPYKRFSPARFGGYALLLSHSFNWWFKSALFKGIGLGLLILGLILIVLGRMGNGYRDSAMQC